MRTRCAASGIAMLGDGLWILLPPQAPPRNPMELAGWLLEPDLPHALRLAGALGTRARRPEAADRGWLRPFLGDPAHVHRHGLSSRPGLDAGELALSRVAALYGQPAAQRSRDCLKLSFGPDYRIDQEVRARLAGFLPAGKWAHGPTCLACQLNAWMERDLLSCARYTSGDRAPLALAAVREWERLDPALLVEGRLPARGFQIRLAWSLLAPGQVDLPAGVPVSSLERLLSLGRSWKQLGPVWRELLDRQDRYSLEALLDRGLPPDLLRRALSCQDLWDVARLGHARKVRRFFQFLGRVEQVEMPEGYEDWLAALIQRGGQVVPALALVMLAGGLSQDNLVRLHSLGQALTDPALQAPLREWSHPRLLGPLPDLERLVELGLPRGPLVELVHHRRLAGMGETLSRGLLAPLRQAEREATERAYLRQRPELARRLRRLCDPELEERRLEGTLRRSHHRLARALEPIRRLSLEAVLEQAARRLLARSLGHRTRGWELPEGWYRALFLLRSDSIQLPLFLSFLEDLALGRPLCQRPANLLWLRQARLNREPWLRGFSARLTVQGQVLHFRTEQNPLEVLKMGSYFCTCLSLEDGDFSHSTLANALDVNKQVLFGRRPDGTVVARKLIGANLAGELAGYQVYAHEHTEPVRQALHEALARYAEECGLRLSDRATPEDLHKAEWWDDGNEPWGLSIPDSDEEAFLRGELEAVDPDGPWHGPALFRRILASGGVARLPAYDRALEAMLTAAGRVTWVGSVDPRMQPGCLDRLLRHLPWRRQAVLRLASLRLPRGGWEGQPPGPALALLSMRELRRVLDNLWVARSADRPELAGWSELLQVVYRREQDHASLVRMAWDNPWARQLVLRVASREAVPDKVRSALSPLGREPEEPLPPTCPEELALTGADGGPGQARFDLWQLWQLVRSMDRVLATVARGQLGLARKLVEVLERESLVERFADHRLDSALLAGPNPDGVVLWARLRDPQLRVGLALTLDRGLSEPARRELARLALARGRFGLACEWARALPAASWAELGTDLGWPDEDGEPIWLAFEQDDPVALALARGLLRGPIMLSRLDEGARWCHPDRFADLLAELGQEWGRLEGFPQPASARLWRAILSSQQTLTRP